MRTVQSSPSRILPESPLEHSADHAPGQRLRQTRHYGDRRCGRNCTRLIRSQRTSPPGFLALTAALISTPIAITTRPRLIRLNSSNGQSTFTTPSIAVLADQFGILRNMLQPKPSLASCGSVSTKKERKLAAAILGSAKTKAKARAARVNAKKPRGKRKK